MVDAPDEVAAAPAEVADAIILDTLVVVMSMEIELDMVKLEEFR